MTQAYPLAWPLTTPRTQWRNRSDFGERSIAVCVAEITRQLGLLRARDVVISTNLLLRNDGLPRSNQPQPRDTGAAVYFKLKGKPHVIACDKWRTVEENMWAIAKDIDATRGKQRWGCGTVEQAFAGYAQLPPGGADGQVMQTSERPWRAVLDLPFGYVSQAQIDETHRALLRKNHPDLGGTHDRMAEINAARDRAYAEFDYK